MNNDKSMMFMEDYVLYEKENRNTNLSIDQNTNNGSRIGTLITIGILIAIILL